MAALKPFKAVVKDILLTWDDSSGVLKNYNPGEVYINPVGLDLSKPNIIMCTWQRPERFLDTIKLLEKQTITPNLLVYNNNLKIKDHLERVSKNSTKVDVRTFHSPKNIGGYGRFYLAREVAKLGVDKVIFIDDDQVLKFNYVERLLAEYRPKTLVSSWAFQINNPLDYWDRSEIKPGEEADYAGTGGMIIDTQIFLEDEELFKCPYKYWFVEDLWLTYRAKINGYKVVKGVGGIEQLEDGKDQVISWKMAHRKRKFLQYLIRKRGFELIMFNNTVNQASVITSLEVSRA